MRWVIGAAIILLWVLPAMAQENEQAEERRAVAREVLVNRGLLNYPEWALDMVGPALRHTDGLSPEEKASQHKRTRQALENIDMATVMERLVDLMAQVYTLDELRYLRQVESAQEYMRLREVNAKFQIAQGAILNQEAQSSK